MVVRAYDKFTRSPRLNFAWSAGSDRCESGAKSVRIWRHHTTLWDKKKPPHTRLSSVWRCLVWWSWRELNPRPQAFVRQIYMLSVLF